MTSDLQANFNQVYHDMRAGSSSQTSENWSGLFDSLAEQIIMDLHPTTVLDAGCGRGYLISSLRQRGVEAWGMDDSEAAIRNVLPECQPYCQVRSILEPLPQERYDLIVCIDILERYSPEEAIQAVENLCLHTDNILLSCPPIDTPDSASTNVQPPEYWTRLFDRFGFIHDLEFDASYIAPWAMRLVEVQPALEDRLATYERKIWQLSQEAALRRELSLEYKNELARKEMDLKYWMEAPKRLQSELDAIRNSASWKLTMRLQNFRERTIPLGSRREKSMRSMVRGFGHLRREGLVKFIPLAFQRLKVSFQLRRYKQSQTRKLRASTLPKNGQVSEIESLVVRPKLEAHTENVDIIICVHNALEDVERCLTSLLEHTTQPYRIILVDDGSSELTAQYLREFAAIHQPLLLRTEAATGYPRAANRGMRASSADYLVLLNSDTILTPEWLDRLFACLQSDPKLGMVGPLSNTASWQSVPKIEDHGDWASNPLPEGISPSRMAQLIAAHSGRLYVEMPLLNGFCLLIRRKLLDEVGLFDEDNFGQGYGEEDDLVLRARKRGWKMALADDAYVYHAQSKSYSTDQRLALSERGGKILRDKHGDNLISESVRFCQYGLVLEGIRARAQVAVDRAQCISQGKQFANKKILFVLPIIYSPGGGANVIFYESNALLEMGVKVSFFHPEEHRQSFIKSYPEQSLYALFGEPEVLQAAALNYDAVVATYNPTVGWLGPLACKETYPKLGYYIQGFEPWMYAQDTPAYQTALDSYTLIDDMVLFSKTEWTRQQVKAATGRESEVIGASLDIDLFRPRPRRAPQWPDGPIRIAAMIRPESPYREPLKTMQLLRQISQKYKGEVEILLFGTPLENPDFLKFPHDFPWKLFGILTPDQVANLLSQSDIFVDYSTHQAMGLAAMEAMACGCAVIVPQHGGTSSYAVHEHNSLIVDTASYENVYQALQRLIDDESLRSRIQRNAVHDICTYFPEHAALNMLRTLFLR